MRRPLVLPIKALLVTLVATLLCSPSPTVATGGVPAAPSITGITQASGQLSVAFTAGSDGGSSITNYEYSTNGGSTWTTPSPPSTSSPIVITGLTNGTTYNVQLRAVNASGPGAATASTSATAGPAGCADASVFSGGDGSLATPFIVTTSLQLQAISAGWYQRAPDYSCYARNFLQASDIDMTGISFRPISGSGAAEYEGTYDGGGYSITNLSITGTAPNDELIGLFGLTSNATIKNLTVRGTVSGRQSVGGVIGVMRGGLLKDVTVGVDVTGRTNVGGAVGIAERQSPTSSPVLEGVTSAGTVTGVAGASNVGGIVGSLALGTLRRAVVNGDVRGPAGLTGSNFIGGLVGYASTATIELSQMNGAVEAAGSGVVGGLVGILVGTPAGSRSLTNSRASGPITGLERVGGLVGRADTGQITNSLSTGVVTAVESGAPLIGGVLGEDHLRTNEVLGLVWNISVNTPTMRSVGNVTSEPAGITAASTTQAKALTTYASAGWSISQDWAAGTTWGMCPGTDVNSGYPYLRWRYSADPCPSTPPAPAPDPEPVVTPTPTPSPTQAAVTVPTVSVAPPANPVTVASGAATMLIGGQPTEVTRTPENRGSGFTMSGGGVTASAVPPPTGFSSGGTSTVTMSGYAPDSQVDAFLFSTPVPLGALTVGVDGIAKGTIAIPTSVPPGNHTLQFTGWTPTNLPVVLSAGITVKPQVKRVQQRVTFIASSRLPDKQGRASIPRVVAEAAALVQPTRTVVTYPGSGAPAQVRLAQSRAKTVAASLRANGLVGPIAVAKEPGRERTSRNSQAVVVTVTGGN